MEPPGLTYGPDTIRGMECGYEGCTKPVKCRGYCSAHYERLRKYGSPDVVMPPSPPPIRRLHDVCTVEGCELPHLAKGYCNSHYRKHKAWGDPLVDMRRKPQTCQADGCDKRVHGHGWCFMHYQRWRAHGDADGAPTFTTCIVADCDRASRSRRSPFCEMHYYRIRRNGHLDRLEMRAEVVGYRQAHVRIEKRRGTARMHQCVDCGKRAEHWSYDHGDPDHLIGPAPHFLPYSLSVDHYEPRCRPCHRAFDRGRPGWDH